MFARADLRRVMIQQRHGDLPISIFLDGHGAVRAVEDVVYGAPTGEQVSAARAERLARRYLADAGVDPESGTLRVVSDPPGEWFVTLDRTLDGYPVANMPMSWWLSGDKVYVGMRPDGRLTQLYAVPVEQHRPLPDPLDKRALQEHLAAFADRPRRDLRGLDAGFFWVQPSYGAPEGMAPELALGYCATDRKPQGWTAWCVDAGTGEPIARGEAYD
jgi:hypothetical protein